MTDQDRCPTCGSVVPQLHAGLRREDAPRMPGAADCVVDDIKLGNRAQFSQRGDVPGDMRATNAIDGLVSFETAWQTTMDVVMTVTDLEQHSPRIARTLRDGPGNAVLVRGCSCGADVMSAVAFAEHVGWPADAVHALLGLVGIAQDLLEDPTAMKRQNVLAAIAGCLKIRRHGIRSDAWLEEENA